MEVKRGLYHCNAGLLWSSGTALFGVSGPDILEYGELSSIRGKPSSRNEPRTVGNAQRIADRGRNPQTQEF